MDSRRVRTVYLKPWAAAILRCYNWLVNQAAGCNYHHANTGNRAENEIVGEALVALRHDELKEMGIASVGHRLTILKSVYDVKVNQDIPIDPDHYIPLCRPSPYPKSPFTC